ncbi:unnamed protein product [Hydatigera taeniaeformis]|uniref:DCB domain-containing protein n=1 Tax=Hydatigena taeniaeformis TaxID=6205 RepID=A0A0R3X906_HYDTA|nr:unnamed protein product [Hydatigera taeniaeformis]
MNSQNHGEENADSRGEDLNEDAVKAASIDNNANTCTPSSGQVCGNIDAESVKRTVAQLKTSVSEISRVICNQASTGEGRILKEIKDIKMQLCEIRRQLKRQNNEDEETEGEGANETSAETTDTNLVGNPTLRNIQETLKTLQCKLDAISLNEINETLTAVLADVDKLLSSQDDGECKVSEGCTEEDRLKSTTQLNKAVACLQKQIKCIKCDAVIEGCDLESNLRSMLTILNEVITTNRPDSNKLGKLNKTLKLLTCELSRQGGKGAQLANEIVELQNSMQNNEATNGNSNNSDHCCADLSETAQMAHVLEQLQSIIQCSQPDIEFPDCGLEANISFLMDKLVEILQSDECESKPSERVTQLVACLESEVCKQCPCECEILEKIHAVQRMLTPLDQCCSNKFDIYQTNVNQCGASLQPTPELCNIAKQLQNIIKCLKPDAQFPSGDLHSTIMSLLEMLKSIIQCGESSASERIITILKCLERELYKQCEAAAALLAKVREIQQLLNRGNGCGGSNQQRNIFQCGSDQCGNDQCGNDQGGNDPCGASLKPTRLLTSKVREIRQLLNGGMSSGASNRQAEANQCGASLQPTPELCNILKQLQNLIKCLKPDAQFSGRDLQSAIICMLQVLKTIIQSGCVDPSALERIGSLLKCLESELLKQCEAASAILPKVREIQQLLNRGNGCEGSSQQRNAFQYGNDQCGTSIKPSRLLTCLIKHIQNVIHCVKPDLQVPSSDLESTLLFLLNQLKEIIQSGCVNPKALEKVPKMMQCLETELLNQGQSNSPIMAKTREIRQLLSGGLSGGSSNRQADFNQCSASLKTTPELCKIINHLQNIIKCLKPDVQCSGCDLQSTIMCLLDNLKMIIQSGCVDPSALEKVGSVLRCLEGELCKQYEAASSLLVKVREIQQMLNRGNGCGGSSQQRCGGGGGFYDTSALKETPTLRCLVVELQKIIQCLKPDIHFKSCDLESTFLCCLKILQDIVPYQSLQSSVMGKVKKILDSLECEMCDQGLFQSNLLTAIMDVKQMISNQKSAFDPTCGGESLEDVVSRTVKTMDECIRELEYVLRDFVGNGGCEQNDRGPCFSGNNDCHA